MSIHDKENRIAVYTVIVGAYDTLRRPKVTDPNCDYYCITDNRDLTSDFWQIINIDNPECLDNTRLSRFPKILPNKYFPEYEESVYVDPNMEIRASLNDYISSYSTGEPMLCMKHTWRDCIYDEAEECATMGKDDAEVIRRQTEKFRADGFPEHFGLSQNSVLYRKHNDERVIHVMEDWWEIVRIGSKRDQLSFIYVCWKNGFKYDVAYEDWLNTKYFRRYPHHNEAFFFPGEVFGKIYFDNGDGFREICSTNAKSQLVNLEQNRKFHDTNRPLPLAYRFEESFTCPPNTKGIRFDPIEGYVCVLTDFAAYAGDMRLSVLSINGKEIDGDIYFETIDPQILIDYPMAGSRTVNISYDIYVFVYHDDWRLVSKVLQIEAAKNTLAEIVVAKDVDLESLASAKDAEFAQMMADKDAEFAQMIADKDAKLESLTAENKESMERLVSANCSELARLFSEKEALLVTKDRALLEAISVYENAFFWKITKPARKTIDWMKKAPGLHLVIKGMKSLKQKGIKHTWSKVWDKLHSSRHVKYSSAALVESRPSGNLATQKHSESLDIIICVHNAYEDVKRCIESVIEFTSEPYRIIIVDDGSEEQTRDYLVGIDECCSNITRLRNDKGNGYCFAANMGMRASRAQYMILLNSDTIVTEGWVDKLIACAKSDPEIGVVGPLSNTASWQSVPRIFDENGDWCHNELPEGCSVAEFGKLIEEMSGKIYPQVPLLNGFCMMITRQAIENVGYFDEENFGPGFGEEDDFNLRVGKINMKLAVADDTFIYHAQSKSYTDEKRMVLCEISGKKLRAKHGDALLDSSVHVVHKNLVFEGIRARAANAVECARLIAVESEKFEGKRILIILPICEAGGGGNVIIQEACAMQRMGVDVWLFNLTEHKQFFEAAYPSLSLPILYGNVSKDLHKYAKEFDAVCCTLYSSVQFCNFTWMEHPPKVVYYIQDFEPYFFAQGSNEYTQALHSYTAADDLIRVTKTEWNAAEVEKNCGVTCHVIGPSLNLNLFRPRKLFLHSESVHICAMIRPSSPRRAAEQTVRILACINNKFRNKVEITVFGCTNEELNTLSVPEQFDFVNMGAINPEQMAVLLSKNDIFADFSVFQAMGLTALEAMASGCAVIVPTNGGSGCYAVDGENCLVVDTASFDECCCALSRLVNDEELRNRLAFRAVSDVCAYYPEKCAGAFLDKVFGGEAFI
jgi:GT2 family glycosyltransferase/glycosyltransferase involved in cell wall biosynthesis